MILRLELEVWPDIYSNSKWIYFEKEFEKQNIERYTKLRIGDLEFLIKDITYVDETDETIVDIVKHGYIDLEATEYPAYKGSLLNAGFEIKSDDSQIFKWLGEIRKKISLNFSGVDDNEE